MAKKESVIYVTLCLPIWVMAQIPESHHGIECHNATENWTCQDYWFLLERYGTNLEHGLHCLGYDRNQSPDEAAPEKGITDNMRIALKFTHISSLQDNKEIFEPEFWFVMFWNETRLRFPPECRSANDSLITHSMQFDVLAKTLWIPSVDLYDVIQMQPRRAFREDTAAAITKTGAVFFGRRYTSKLNCRMDFGLYPFDIQHCHFKLYLSRGNQDMLWEDGAPTDPADIALPNWSVTLRKTQDHNFTTLAGTPTKGIAMTFTLKRMVTFHLLQTFLPSFMIMVASVLSVFVPARHVPGRITLCITAFLAMIELINGARDSWPQTTQLKAIDYWSVICYAFVFIAMAEYTIVLYLLEYHEHIITFPQRGIPVQVQNWTTKRKGVCNVDENLADQIESYARMIFPTLLIGSQMAFWITIANARDAEYH